MFPCCFQNGYSAFRARLRANWDNFQKILNDCVKRGAAPFAAMPRGVGLCKQIKLMHQGEGARTFAR